MARVFRDEDLDKTLVTPDGYRIGSVREIREDKAVVERNDQDHDDLTDAIKDMLGWGDDDEVYEVDSEHVDSYTTDEIRLREYR